MGVIISRFRRKKTTTEVLERLETKIKSIEQDGQYKEQTHRRVIGYVMAYSVGLYVLFAILYYFMYVGKSQYWLHSVLHASPLLVLPILVIFLRSAISWYYNWSLSKNKTKLGEMRAEKKKLLEEVMNTETYKVAKEILDKYGGPEEQSKALRPFVPSQNVPGTPTAPMSPVPATPGQLRQRQIAITSTPNNKNLNVEGFNNTPMALYKGPRLRSDQLPRPLMDKNRSALDKVVDYLLKDGPNHRMALICTQCSSHNGMAMIEEFEYVSYTCAYCGKLNPARKQRPAAPLLTPARAPPSPAARCGEYILNPARKQRPAAPLLTPARAPPSPAARCGAGDDSSLASSGSDSEEEKRNGLSNIPSSEESDRPPSTDEQSKSNKKED